MLDVRVVAVGAVGGIERAVALPDAPEGDAVARLDLCPAEFAEDAAVAERSELRCFRHRFNLPLDVL